MSKASACSQAVFKNRSFCREDIKILHVDFFSEEGERLVLSLEAKRRSWKPESPESGRFPLQPGCSGDAAGSQSSLGQIGHPCSPVDETKAVLFTASVQSSNFPLIHTHCRHLRLPARSWWTWLYVKFLLPSGRDWRTGMASCRQAHTLTETLWAICRGRHCYH